MRPINGSSPASEIRTWRSPIPYLFGGLAIMMALISLALVILICFHKKHASQLTAEGENIKHAIPLNIETDSEPKILVIMAGDDKPTYLGKPITPSTYCSCEVEPITSSSSSSERG
ncbi:protein GLUTAMINE DUMPER 6-like [Abrus precatorius]|uniref:Protein GLUTAMINE DUMPER 6-like n=1 Tax=Abrus precatorius TaxID=3816 RepID=A0A8B8LVJ3_ABRPR|nr:protein GLUTAMINE DUMPER 6-like [Abrus precatorius]